MKNLKFILGAFEQMSDLKINFHKSELFLFGEAIDKNDEYAKIFMSNRCLAYEISRTTS